jgi:uncharacterized membrane protein
MEKARSKKLIASIASILMYVFLAISIFAVILAIFSRRHEDGAAEIFGYQIRVVTSDSMAKCEFTNVKDYDIKDIPKGSVVFIKTVPRDNAEAAKWYDSLEIGDVLTFRYVYTRQVTITHRITGIEDKQDGSFVFELTGDNTASESGQMHQIIDTSVSDSPNYVIGKVVGQSRLLGWLMSTWGIVLIIILPCVAIMTNEIVKITRLVGSDKKAKQKAEMEKTQEELETLRRRLAELEANDKSENTDGE